MSTAPVSVRHRPKAVQVLGGEVGRDRTEIVRFNKASDRKKRGDAYRQVAQTKKWFFYMKEAKEKEAKEGKERKAAKRSALKIIEKKSLKTASFEKNHVPHSMIDIAIQMRFKQTTSRDNGETLAIADVSGCVYIIKLKNLDYRQDGPNDEPPLPDSALFQVVAAAKVTGRSSFYFAKVEFWDAETLVGMGSDGSLWRLDVPTLTAAFTAQNPKPIYSDDKVTPVVPVVVADESTFPPAFHPERGGSRIAPAETCVEFDCGVDYIALTKRMNAEVTLLERDPEGGKEFVRVAGKFSPDDTPADCVQWLGGGAAEKYKSLSNVLAAVTNWGRKVTFYRVANASKEGGWQPKQLFEVEVDDANNEWEVPPVLRNEGSEKNLFAGVGDTFVLTAMGRRSVMFCSLVPSPDTEELSLYISDRLLPNGAASPSPDGADEDEFGILQSLSFGEHKPNESKIALLTNKRLTVVQLAMDSDTEKRAAIKEEKAPAAAVPTPTPAPAAVPVPPQQPATPTEKKSASPPPVLDAGLVTPEKAQRMKAAYGTPPAVLPPTAAGPLLSATTAPPPPPAPISYEPLLNVENDGDIGKVLHTLQQNLFTLRDNLSNTHTNLVQRFEVLNHHIATFTDDVRASSAANQALIVKQSSDIQERAHSAYYSRIQADLRVAQDKLHGDLADLAQTLKEPIKKMFADLEAASKATKESVDKNLSAFGEEMANLMQNQIAEQLKGANISAKGLATEFSKELKSQLQAMLEVRMEEICDFQVLMELDYVSVCKSIATHLEATFTQAKEAASREAGAQLGKHETQAVQGLRQLEGSVEKSMASILEEFRGLRATHDRVRKDADQKLEVFLQNQAADVPLVRPSGQQQDITSLLSNFQKKEVARQSSALSDGKLEAYLNQSNLRPLASADSLRQVESGGLAALTPFTATPQQELDELVAVGKHQEAIDHVNKHGLSMKAYRDAIFPELDCGTLIPSLGVEYRQNLFRDVLMCLKEEDLHRVKQWLVKLMVSLNVQTLRKSAGATPEQFMQLVDWGIAEAENMPDIQRLLTLYRQRLQQQ